VNYVVGFPNYPDLSVFKVSVYPEDGRTVTLLIEWSANASEVQRLLQNNRLPDDINTTVEILTAASNVRIELVKLRETMAQEKRTIELADVTAC